MERRSPIRNPQVGKNLRRLRLEKKLSIRAFCVKMQPPISPVQLLATEMLKREPTFDMIRRYATALEVGIDELNTAQPKQKTKGG